MIKASRTRGRLAEMYAPRELDYGEYDLAKLSPGSIFVEILRAHVCGPELHIWNEQHSVIKHRGLGHEMVSRFVALGDVVTEDNDGETLPVGDPVVCTYFQTFQKCPQCLGGQFQISEKAYEFFGLQPENAPHSHSAFAIRYYLQPLRQVHNLQEKLPDAPKAGANHDFFKAIFGTYQIELKCGETLLIQVAEARGSIAVAVAKELGARVTVVDGVAYVLEQANCFGAAEVIIILVSPDSADRLASIQKLTKCRGSDVAFEVADIAALEEVLKIVRLGWRYLGLGNRSSDPRFTFDPGFVKRKEFDTMHLERYEAWYLWKLLSFFKNDLTKYLFDQIVEAEFTLDQVEICLEKSLNREVTPAAITIEEGDR